MVAMFILGVSFGMLLYSFLERIWERYKTTPKTEENGSQKPTEEEQKYIEDIYRQIGNILIYNGTEEGQRGKDE